MAVVQYTFAFATNSQGLSMVGASGIIFAHEPADGNPAGSVKFTFGQKNSTVSEFGRSSGTIWESFGVPVNSTVNSVRVVSYLRKIAANGKISAHNHALRIIGLADLAAETLPTATGGWLSGAGIAGAQTVNQPSAQEALFEIAYTVSTLGGGGTAAIDARFDQIILEIDYTTSIAQNLQRTASDTVAIGSDTISRVATFGRTMLDTLTLSEGINRSAIIFNRTASDSLNAVTDGITRVAQFVRTTTENIAIGVDAVVAEKVRMLFRAASDTVAIGADTVGRTVSFVRTLSDTTAVSDFVSAANLIVRTAADSVVTSDTVTRITTMVRSATDITTLTEFVSRAGFLVSRTAADTTGSINDSLVRQANKLRTAVDTTVLTESVQRAWNGARSAADTLPAVVDSIATSAAVIIYRTVNDSVNIVTDAISRTANMGRGAIDTVTTSDFVERISIYARTVSDSVSDISDFVVRSGVLVRRTVEDSVPLVGDVVGFVKGIPAFVGERIKVFAQRPWFVVRRDGKTYPRHESNRINVRKD